MTCPFCKEVLKNTFLDNQDILHCSNCGLSFFEDNGINRISFENAKRLSEDKYIQSPKLPQNIDCPRDGVPVKQVENSEAVPRTVIMFTCPVCHGILVSADNLERFKHAQLAKLDYFKAWNMPLGSLRGVFAIALLLILGGGIYWGYGTITQEATMRSEASELFKKVDITYTGQYAFISFKTKIPVKASLIEDNRSTGKLSIIPISRTARTIHTATLVRPGSNETVSYKIRLEDNAGHTVDSKEIIIK